MRTSFSYSTSQEFIREEIQPTFRADGFFDSNFVYSSCSKLDSVWRETLRVSATSAITRNVIADTTIGGKVLQESTKLFISARQLHFSSIDFGDDVSTFDPDRFIQNPSLYRSPAFRPFGGGATQCPGRFLAKHLVLSFVAVFFNRFVVSVAMPQSLPRYQESKPAIGITVGGRPSASQTKRAG